MRILLVIVISACISCSNSTGTVRDKEGNCIFQNGIHSAKVSYRTPNKAEVIYPVTVTVFDCRVVRINFPSKGWLGDRKIKPAEINAKGETTAEDQAGTRWNIRLKD